MTVPILKTMIVCSLLIFSSCTREIPTPFVSGGDRAAANIQATWNSSYASNDEYYEMDFSVVEAEALFRCRSWGYKGIDLFPVINRTCTIMSQYGCFNFNKKIIYQCTDIEIIR